MWSRTQLKVTVLLWLAFIAAVCSFFVKDEASLFFLIAFLALFIAGFLYSIGLYTGGYLSPTNKKQRS